MDWVTVLIGLSGGFVGGLLGVGGGVLYVPLLVLLKGMEPHKAVGTSLLIIVFTAVFGAFFHHKEGMVDTRAAVLMGLFSIVGVWLGTKTSLVLDAPMLRKVFSVFLLVMAFKLFFMK